MVAVWIMALIVVAAALLIVGAVGFAFRVW